MEKSRTERFLAIYAAVLATLVAAFQIVHELNKGPKLQIVSEHMATDVKPTNIQGFFELRSGLTVANVGSKPASIIEVNIQGLRVSDRDSKRVDVAFGPSWRCKPLPLLIGENEARSLSCVFIVSPMGGLELKGEYEAEVEYEVHTTTGTLKFTQAERLYSSPPLDLFLPPSNSDKGSKSK